MTGTIRVLHVDDNPDFADLADFLERKRDHLHVESEASPTDALEHVRDREFDCIVSAHDMPEMTGIELLEAMQEEDATLPFILFTGKGSEEVASEAVSAGVADYLQKESGTEQYTLLANRIENAVERYRSQRVAERQKRRLEALVSNLPGLVYRCGTNPDGDGRGRGRMRTAHWISRDDARGGGSFLGRGRDSPGRPGDGAERSTRRSRGRRSLRVYVSDRDGRRRDQVGVEARSRRIDLGGDVEALEGVHHRRHRVQTA